MSKLDVLLTRIFIQLGFIVTAGSLLPSLLALFPWSANAVWRLSSAAVAIPTLLFAIIYPVRRRAASGVRAPLGVWLDVFVLVGAGVVLMVNALGMNAALEPAVFSASVTVILYLGGWAYLQALGILLRQHWARSVPS